MKLKEIQSRLVRKNIIDNNELFQKALKENLCHQYVLLELSDFRFDLVLENQKHFFKLLKTTKWYSLVELNNKDFKYACENAEHLTKFIKQSAEDCSSGLLLTRAINKYDLFIQFVDLHKIDEVSYSSDSSDYSSDQHSDIIYSSSEGE